LRLLALLAALSLVAAACGDDGDGAAETTTAPAATEAPEGETGESEEEMTMDHLGDGSLGVVQVEPGGAVQIRSLEAITGDVAFLGLPNQRATMLAVEHFGSIHGFDVEVGVGLDDLCSSDGGQAAAQIVVADEDVLGKLEKRIVLVEKAIECQGHARGDNDAQTRPVRRQDSASHQADIDRGKQ